MKRIDHKPDCTFQQAEPQFWKLDPTCPRCAVRLRTGRWPLMPKPEFRVTPMRDQIVTKLDDEYRFSKY